MRRVVVAGARGFFGAEALGRLRARGITALSAGRGGLPVRLDVEDPASIRGALRAGDVVLDACGPFQDRSPTLARAAVELGFDLVDIADSLAYVEQVLPLVEAGAARGIRILPARSTVSALSEAALAASGLRAPRSLRAFLCPAPRFTANRGSARSLLESLGTPVRVRAGGRLVRRRGWTTTRAFPMPAPLGPIEGHLFESADAVMLARLRPSLDTVEMYVTSRVPGLDRLFDLAARLPGAPTLLGLGLPLGLPFARALGAAVGALGYEIEDGFGRVVRLALVTGRDGHGLAVEPAVAQVAALARGAPRPMPWPEAGGLDWIRLPA